MRPRVRTTEHALASRESVIAGGGKAAGVNHAAPDGSNLIPHDFVGDRGRITLTRPRVGQGTASSLGSGKAECEREF